jgi:hypothetical protein
LKSDIKKIKYLRESYNNFYIFKNEISPKKKISYIEIKNIKKEELNDENKDKILKIWEEYRTLNQTITDYF